MTRSATPHHTSDSVGETISRAAVLRRLELAVTRRLDGLMAGDYHTSGYGPGSERAGAREYQPGDDARRIDWNLTARSHAAHVRVTEADRELETWVVADRSASLDFGTTTGEKRDVVLGAAAAFGVLTVRGGNRFGVIASGGPRLISRPAASGRRAMMAALAMLYDTPRWDTPPDTSADLTAALTTARRLQPRRGQVIVVSDFLDPGGWPRALRELSLRHQVIAVHVVDPREAELPDVGMLRLVDPETGQTLTVQTRSPELRTRYAEAAAARADRIEASIRSARADYVALSTADDWLTTLIRYVTGRRSPRLPGMEST